MAKKYYFRIEAGAEDWSYGYVLLTDEQARMFNEIANPENWTAATVERFSGRTRIILNDRIPEEWFDYHKEQSRAYAYSA